MVFENFEPIFGEPKVEWGGHSSCPLRPFLFHAYVLDSFHLVIYVTDFHSDTWGVHLSISMLEDIRDIIGLGGSWSEFADYFINSLKSENLKLILEANLNSDGISNAKLIAQKSKGMPLITIPLIKLVDSTASEAMSNLSLRLFKAYQSIKCSLVEEQEQSIRLTNMRAAEKERNEIMQKQLEQRQKFQKTSDSEKAVSTNGMQSSPDKQAGRDTKVKNRVVPAHRRTKVRGALLHNSDDE
ncbi:hypothetical protein Lal_00023765 [Lupinus albus]|uniref:Uncharacterized protein n=1 Tax=Lupinus albus TaxID=3870 RepID=A0A6A4PIJ2_LUPAL|nr:hypothetical protein Lalb_Chr13g0296631 [Lupinus albus]KAF1887758.1 hypothetical protein Lal_00023765 [Lupinus albus]